MIKDSTNNHFTVFFRSGAFFIVILVILNYLLNCFNCTNTIPHASLWTIYLFIGFISLGLGLFFSNKSTGGKRDYKVVYDFYKYSRYNFWISLFWSLGLSSLIAVIIIFFIENVEKKFWEYLITILFTFLFGISGLVITYIVSKRQKQEVVGLRNFLKEIHDVLSDWRIIEEIRQQNNSNKDIHDIFIAGFHPLIGIISIPNDDIFLNYKEKLIDIAKNPNVNLKIICYGNKEIETIMENLHKSSSEKTDIKKDSANFFAEIEKDDNKHLAVWRTSNLNALHFLIIDNVAYQFSVVPNVDKKMNELVGIRTEDIFIIDFLIKTFKELESQCITPAEYSYEKSSKVWKFIFEKQNNIKDIYVYRENSDSYLDLNLHLQINGGVVNNIEIPENYLHEVKFIQFEFEKNHLNKKGDYIKSEKSKPIYLNKL